MNELFINFSDWILVWYILYKLNIIPYNPKIFILFGIIDNIIGLSIIIFNNKNKLNDNKDEYIEVSIHFIIKILIFFSLRNSLYTMNDFIKGVIIFLIYLIYLKIKYNLTIFELKKRFIKNHIN